MSDNISSDINVTKNKNRKNGGYPENSIKETYTNGFFTVDRKWTVLYWNSSAEKLLGIAAVNIIGKNLWEMFAGTIPLNFYTVYQKAFLHDIPIHFVEYWPEMGAWFDVITYHCNDTLSVSFTSSNQPVHADNPSSPEKHLKILNELYRYVTEVTNDCLWEWDLKNNQLFWIDGGHKRVFGYPIENAIIPQSFWESRVHPDDRKRVLKKLNRIITKGDEFIWEEEYRFEKLNGEYVYVHDRGRIIIDSEDKPSRMIGATQDITARKLAEAQLFESERNLALLARQTVNVIIITDQEGKITWVNSAFTEITEYELEEVMGKKPGSFLQGKETDQKTVQYFRQKIKDKKPFNCTLVNYSKSGRKYWMQMQGQALLDEKGIHTQYFAIGTDITETILLENKLSKERIEKQREITHAVLLAQERERAEIGRELHDNINQILGAAKMYIELAKADEELLQVCLDKSSEYIVNVIAEIRIISKKLSIPALRAMGITDDIKILLDDLRALHPTKFEFNSDPVNKEDIDENLQQHIFRIVQEQVTNIIKHADASHATINLTKDQSTITLIISDNGKGDDLSQQKKGVGIVNITSRVEICGGTLTIISKPGEGYGLKAVFPLNDNP